MTVIKQRQLREMIQKVLQQNLLEKLQLESGGLRRRNLLEGEDDFLKQWAKKYQESDYETQLMQDMEGKGRSSRGGGRNYYYDASDVELYAADLKYSGLVDLYEELEDVLSDVTDKNLKSFTISAYDVDLASKVYASIDNAGICVICLGLITADGNDKNYNIWGETGGMNRLIVAYEKEKTYNSKHPYEAKTDEESRYLQSTRPVNDLDPMWILLKKFGYEFLQKQENWSGIWNWVLHTVLDLEVTENNNACLKRGGVGCYNLQQFMSEYEQNLMDFEKLEKLSDFRYNTGEDVEYENRANETRKKNASWSKWAGDKIGDVMELIPWMTSKTFDNSKEANDRWASREEMEGASRDQSGNYIEDIFDRKSNKIRETMAQLKDPRKESGDKEDEDTVKAMKSSEYQKYQKAELKRQREDNEGWKHSIMRKLGYKLPLDTDVDEYESNLFKNSKQRKNKKQ